MFSYASQLEEKSIEELLEFIESGNISEKQDAIFLLGNIGSDKCVSILVKFLENEVLRMDTALALGKIGNKSALGPMVALLSDSNPVVRGIASESLTLLGDIRALEYLKNAYKIESDKFAKKRELEAIEKLTLLISDETETQISVQDLPPESYESTYKKEDDIDLNEGLKYFNEKEYTLASVYLLKAFNKRALSKGNTIKLLKSYYQIGHYKKGIDIGKSYIKEFGLDSKITKELFKLNFAEALKKYQDGDLTGCKQNIKECLAYDPDHVETITKMGDVLSIEGKTEDADRYYNKALNILKKQLFKYPERSSIYSKLGSLYIKLRKYEKAIIEFEKSVASQSSKYENLSSLGYAYYLGGFIEKGINSLQKAININPNYWDAHYKLGSIYVDIGKYSRAVNELRIAQNLNPGEELISYKLGLTYFLAGYYNEASVYLKEFVDKAPLIHKNQIDIAKRNLKQIEDKIQSR